MSSTPSRSPLKPGRLGSERVVGLARNGWTASLGTGGRLRRNRHRSAAIRCKVEYTSCNLHFTLIQSEDALRQYPNTLTPPFKSASFRRVRWTLPLRLRRQKSCRVAGSRFAGQPSWRCLAARWGNEIGTTGQFPAVEAIPITHSVHSRRTSISGFVCFDRSSAQVPAAIRHES